MATRTLTRLVDDIDGAEADETIRFTFDNIQYEIDLSKQNAANFRKAVGEYIDHARKVGGRARKPASTQVDAAAVRAWARSNKVNVSARGRLSADVLVRFVKLVIGSISRPRMWGRLPGLNGSTIRSCALATPAALCVASGRLTSGI